MLCVQGSSPNELGTRQLELSRFNSHIRVHAIVKSRR
jgi:hypothetical protein